MKKPTKGKINNKYGGKVRVATYIQDDLCIIDFQGKDLSWVGLDKEDLRAFIDDLEDKYKKM